MLCLLMDLVRKDSSSQSFSRSLSTIMFSDNRSICSLSMPSSTSAYSAASRYIESLEECNGTNLEHGSSICISLFQCDFERARKSKTGMCSYADSDCTKLEHSSMVLRTFKPICQGTSPAAASKIFLISSKKY